MYSLTRYSQVINCAVTTNVASKYEVVCTTHKSSISIHTVKKDDTTLQILYTYMYVHVPVHVMFSDTDSEIVSE